MSKIIEFFKQKLSIAAGDELPSKYIDKITLLQNSIVAPEVFTESMAEQLDAMLEEFGINIKASSFEEIKTSCNILKSFGFVSICTLCIFCHIMTISFKVLSVFVNTPYCILTWMSIFAWGV